MGTLETDADLWRDALAGDGDAFGALFDRHRDRVFRHAYRLVQHAADAEDTLAAAFLELWRRRRAVRLVDDSVLPWLLLTATNCARNLARSRRRHHAVLDALPREPGEADAPPDPMDRTLVASISRLRPRDARLLALVALADLEIREAAPLVGLSPGAARVRLHRIRATLQDDLGHTTRADYLTEMS
ncbi:MULTISPECIES: RNA polymerase sigma factor [Microbacterium]|jgi:RNA polymerase sigma factor (sigma-70 family)|uniref:RNA polymerase sigma factor n=1 Tax=Microbacterium TaxID=33882 RepID=UPI001D177AAA|nr:sigma-70 family RNA polymerase sigma factor [Microbacterium testaceum]MCC4248748.1 sigma-70 family RNA polymerase sigma factor [Microbacterium testaceum]